MRQTRIHVNQALSPGTELALDDRATEHVARVLRMRVGDPLVLFNGDGLNYPSTVSRCARRDARVRVTEVVPGIGPSKLPLVLAQALVRGNKMDLVLQKAVELGVHSLIPVVTDRCTIELDERRAERRQQHWESVVISACEQCGRSTVPSIAAVRSLSDWCAKLPDDEAMRLALLPNAGRRVRDLAPGNAGAILVVGPEGGFSPADIQTLEGAGFTGLALGPRILRTETAGLAALAALQATHGDL